MEKEAESLGKKGEEPKKPAANDQVWTTVFQIDPESFLEVQRILDNLRAPKPKPIDPKIIEEEVERLWGPED